MTRQLRIALAVFVALVLVIFVHAIGAQTTGQNLHSQINASTKPLAIHKPETSPPKLRALTLQVGMSPSLHPLNLNYVPSMNALTNRHSQRNLMYNAAKRLTTVDAAKKVQQSTTVQKKAASHKRSMLIHVAKGQCLWTIAKDYHTTVHQLVVQNHLHTNVLQIGQPLQIMVKSARKRNQTTRNQLGKSTSKTFVYVVHPGDTLWRISMVFGVPVNQLKLENHLPSNILHIGQDLTITASSHLVRSAVHALLTEAPARLIPVYKAAAAKYGIPWTVLAAIHKEETDFSTTGRSVSSAGAIGPMQFMPATFRVYGVAAPGHVRPNIRNVDDAIYSAAHMLAAQGFNQDPYRAVFAYNQSAAYVHAVLHMAAF